MPEPSVSKVAFAPHTANTPNSATHTTSTMRDGTTRRACRANRRVRFQRMRNVIAKASAIGVVSTSTKRDRFRICSTQDSGAGAPAVCSKRNLSAQATSGRNIASWS